MDGRMNEPWHTLMKSMATLHGGEAGKELGMLATVAERVPTGMNNVSRGWP